MTRYNEKKEFFGPIFRRDLGQIGNILECRDHFFYTIKWPEIFFEKSGTAVGRWLWRFENKTACHCVSKLQDSTMLKTVVIVEDDANIRMTLEISLSASGYRIETFASAEECLNQNLFGDVYIVDIGLPNMDGLSLCKKIRALTQVPIIVLTAQLDENSAVLALQMGADDFVRKPFGLLELKARIDKQLTRTSQNSESIRQMLGLSLNRDLRKCFYNDTEISLTKTEFDLLWILLGAPERVFSREQLILYIDPASEMIDRHLDPHLSRIRSKFRKSGVESVTITSVYGAGYKLENRGNG